MYWSRKVGHPAQEEGLSPGTVLLRSHTFSQHYSSWDSRGHSVHKMVDLGCQLEWICNQPKWGIFLIIMFEVGRPTIKVSFLFCWQPEIKEMEEGYFSFLVICLLVLFGGVSSLFRASSSTLLLTLLNPLMILGPKFSLLRWLEDQWLLGILCVYQIETCILEDWAATVFSALFRLPRLPRPYYNTGWQKCKETKQKKRGFRLWGGG